MANRSLLHRNKLQEFRQWLVSTGHTILEPKGDYEVLRWKHSPPYREGEPMPIVFDRNRGDHLTVNMYATRYVFEWLRGKQQCDDSDVREDQGCPSHYAEQTSPPNDNALSSPLPCDVTIRHVTFKKGVPLRTLVNAADRWLSMAIDKGYSGEEHF